MTEKEIKTIPLLLEVIQRGESKTNFIVRDPKTGQVLLLADSSDEVCQFLDGLSF